MPTGVEAHGGKLRVVFYIKGKRFRESLGLKVSKANVSAAARLRNQIVSEIKADIFDYSKYFPNSVHADTPSTDGRKFREVANTWIESMDELAYSTTQGYKRILNKHFYPSFGGLDIDKISHGMCRQIIANYNWNTGKTRNNVLSVLKRVFEFAKMERLIKLNPTENIGFKKLQKPIPDPFSISEIELIIPCFEQEHWKNYFEFAFFSGLRTSELIALNWNDIDFVNGHIRVHKAKVRGRIKETKTYEERNVMLNERSLKVLMRHKKLTFSNGEEIFINFKTKKRINDDKPPRVAWNFAIAISGVRRRPPYNTRHTYATMLLMSGENIAWIARQMGHSVQMLLKRYARWIDDSESKNEGKKLGDFLKK